MTAEAWAGLEPSRGPSRRGRSRGVDARAVLAGAALVATFVAVIGLYAVSAITLAAYGIDYIDSGGGFFSKFHPSTPLAVAAFVLRCLAARRPVHLAWRLVTADAGSMLLIAAVVIAGIFAALVDKTPLTPLVDTFLLPVIVFLLLRDLERGAAAWLAALVAAVLVLNAGIAIGEYLVGGHLVRIDAPAGVTGDPTQANMVFSWAALLAEDWRAVALLGHPLVNGLVMGSFVICLAAPGSAWIPGVLRYPVLLLSASSLLAFGARTALVLGVVFAAWFFVLRGVEAVGRGVRLGSRRTAAVVLVLGLVIALVALLYASGLIDRSLDRFSNDSGSATTRITMFALLEPLSLGDLLFHPDKDVVATLQRIYGLEFGIESSWIGLVLTYGLVVSAILAAAFLAFWRSVLRASGRGGFAVFVFYTVLISVSASLSGKTTTFAMVLALVVLFLRRDARDPASRQTVKGR